MIWTMQRKDKQIEPVLDAGCYGEMLADALDDFVLFVWCPRDRVHFLPNASYEIHYGDGRPSETKMFRKTDARIEQ